MECSVLGVPLSSLLVMTKSNKHPKIFEKETCMNRRVVIYSTHFWLEKKERLMWEGGHLLCCMLMLFGLYVIIAMRETVVAYAAFKLIISGYNLMLNAF